MKFKYVLDKGVLRGLLLTVTVTLLVTFFAFEEGEAVALAEQLMLAGSVIIGAGYTAWQRIARPNPNLTKKADDKERELIAKGELEPGQVPHA